jgi:membrane-anchored glycerophosphoryl diester phosphodiesterase (GDPDase)
LIPVLDGPAPAGGPPDAEVAMVLVVMIVTWVLMLLGGVAGMVWMWWLTTRTMFVLPLVADRELDFSTAWRMSWQETRYGFWELLLLNFLAGIIGMLGFYVCYVGALVSIPLGVMMVDAAYEGRFAPHAEVLD